MSSLDQVKQKAGRFARRSLWVLFAAFIVFCIGYYFIRTITKSEGTRIGLLYKISKKGIVFKTYEGQLHLGGSVMMTEQSIWNFSVKNAAVYQQLQNYEGKVVKLHYRELVHAFPWQGDTNYLVDQVEATQ